MSVATCQRRATPHTRNTKLSWYSCHLPSPLAQYLTTNTSQSTDGAILAHVINFLCNARLRSEVALASLRESELGAHSFGVGSRSVAIDNWTSAIPCVQPMMPPVIPQAALPALGHTMLVHAHTLYHGSRSSFLLKNGKILDVFHTIGAFRSILIPVELLWHIRVGVHHFHRSRSCRVCRFITRSTNTGRTTC